MKFSTKLVFVSFWFGAAISPSIAVAIDYNLSSQPIFITNNESKCISRNDDKITLLLKGARFQKEADFFSEDKKIGLAIGATPHSENQSFGFGPYEFPILREIDLKDAEEGFIQDGGAHATIMNLIELKSQDRIISRIGYGIKIVKTRGKSDTISIAQRVFESAKQISFPANPYTTSAFQVANVVNGFIDGLIASEDGKNNVIGTSSVSVGFNKTGDNCDPFDDARTGFTLFLFEPNGTVSDELRQNIISIDRAVWGELCFNVNPVSLRPQFASKVDGSCGAVLETSYKSVNNPYVLFYLRAETSDSAQTVSSGIESISNLWAASAKIEQYSQQMGSLASASPTLANTYTETADDIRNSMNALSASLFEENKELERSVKECEAFGMTVIECFPEAFPSGLAVAKGIPGFEALEWSVNLDKGAHPRFFKDIAD